MKRGLIALLLCLSFNCVAQEQKGIASYYGTKFHGRTMANGKPFDMYAMTAAHNTLPLGTRVRVTRLSTNATVVVKITDRGPYIGGRVIDLSVVAATKLGIIEKGLAEVLIEVLDTN